MQLFGKVQEITKSNFRPEYIICVLSYAPDNIHVETLMVIRLYSPVALMGLFWLISYNSFDIVYNMRQEYTVNKRIINYARCWLIFIWTSFFTFSESFMYSKDIIMYYFDYRLYYKFFYSSKLFYHENIK